MLSNSSKNAASRSALESELRQAANDARQAVANAPDDESAADRLRHAVRAYKEAFPRGKGERAQVAPEISDARQLIDEGDFEPAEIMLRKHLAAVPNDPPAMHMMAEIAAYCGLRQDAERILDRSAYLHGQTPAALTDLAKTLYRIAYRQDIPEMVFKAARAIERALEVSPDCEDALAFKADMMMQTRGHNEARATFRRLLDLYPDVAIHWFKYAHLLNALGERGPALAGYRTALALDPANGSGWWNLADLKTAKLFAGDIAEMQSVLSDDSLGDAHRVPIHFAIAKALDSTGSYEQAISQVELGSEIYCRIQPPPRESVISDGAFIRATFTRQFFAAREAWGDPRPGPIFIVGMHRAGSTLVEQILSSHSQIEGTEELYILSKFSRELARAHPEEDPARIIDDLRENDFRAFAARYLEMSGRSRRTDRPYLTDKYPPNWQFVGLIHCMFPNAKIIDVRRNPMDCCFANYMRHYGAGMSHAYSQTEMARHYADYVATMRHFDEVLPGRIHRLIHDDLVDDFEPEVRRLLDYIGVPFEDACLRFFETERPVHTPSAEQVREPINRKGFGRWRSYEPWLAPLKEALGETLNDWRG